MGHITYFNQGMEEEYNSLDKYFVSFFYFVLIYIFFKYSFQYFTWKNVPVIHPSIPFGNIQKALKPKKPRYQYFRDLYEKIKIRGQNHAGLYLFFKPIYMPVNLDYVKNVLSRDFDYFSERGFYSKPTTTTDTKDLGENLLNLQGQKWKELRVALLPIFNSKSIRNFVVNMEKVTWNAIEFLKVRDEKLVSIQGVSENFTLDLVANLFFGVDLNSFIERNTPFEKHLTKIFKNSLYNSKWSVFPILFPGLYKKITLKVFPRESLKYFEKTIRDIAEFREINRVKKNDILQTLLDLPNEDVKIHDVISHCILFSMFTNETISNTMTFALYELARNPQVQEKLRVEIEETLPGDEEGNLTLEMLDKMPFLHQVIQETLRLYPVVPTILRHTSKDYNLPETKGEILEKGRAILISILGIHRDEEIYENPESFDPSRFNDEDYSRRHPYAYIPYGEGPRICPAIKFSNTILKVILVALFKNFKFSLNEKTKTLALSKNYVLMKPKNILYVNVEQINK